MIVLDKPNRKSVVNAINKIKKERKATINIKTLEKLFFTYPDNNVLEDV